MRHSNIIFTVRSARISWVKFKGAIHSTKISGNFGPKLNGLVRSNRKSFEKTGPPFEVVLFSRSDRLEFWLNGSRPKFEGYKHMGFKTRTCEMSTYVCLPLYEAIRSTYVSIIIDSVVGQENVNHSAGLQKYLRISFASH